MTDIRPTVEWCTTNSWPICHQHMTDSQSRCVVEISTNTRPIVYPTIDWLLSDCQLTIEWLSTDYRRLSTNYRLTVDRLSTAISTEFGPSVDRLSTAISTTISTTISTNRSVDTTYSKQDLTLAVDLKKTCKCCKTWFRFLSPVYNKR